MKHHKAIRELSRTAKQRTALLRSLAISLIENGKIQTTEAKAKEMRPYVERLVTKAKANDLSARRTIASKIGEKCAKILVEKVAVEHKDRQGGYLRIIKLPVRKSDAAKMAQIEFV